MLINARSAASTRADNALAATADIVTALRQCGRTCCAGDIFDYFKEHPPARVWVFSRRLPMMHRHGWTGPTAASNAAYAWFVFNARPDTKKALAWVDWKTLEVA